MCEIDFISKFYLCLELKVNSNFVLHEKDLFRKRIQDLIILQFEFNLFEIILHQFENCECHC